jgi:hypothetical protein
MASFACEDCGVILFDLNLIFVEVGCASIIAESSNGGKYAPFFSSGKMCALHASMGNSGRSSNVVWVAWVCCPLGTRPMVMLLLVLCLLMQWLLICRKWPVQPELAMPG